MRKKIDQLAKGIIQYELPEIVLSEQELNLKVEEGYVYEGSFTVENNKHTNVNGMIYSSDERLLIHNPLFTELCNIIQYTFVATKLLRGEEIECQIQIVSDCGEVYIPVTIKVRSAYGNTSIGEVKDLFHFANLAKHDWMEAIKLFKSKDFERIFLTHDEKTKLLYKSLIKSISSSQAMEEFLVTIQKKQPVKVVTSKEKLEYKSGGERFQDKIMLTKSGWGYLEMKVSTDVDFIELEHKIVWADNFLGSNYSLEFVVCPDKMIEGKNFGTIYFTTVYQEVAIKVEYHKITSERVRTKNHTQKRKIQSSMVNNYLEFRASNIKQEAYVARCKELIGRMQDIFDGDILELYKIHVDMILEKYESAGERLEKFHSKLDILKQENVMIYCAYLYLRALQTRTKEEILNSVKEITSYYEQGYKDYRILWFLLYLDAKYEIPQVALKQIKEQYSEGCYSPVLYYEAVSMYNKDSSLLMELSEFEISVINFGVKRNLLQKEVVNQYIYLTSREKLFNGLVYYNLKSLYAKYKSKEVLAAICALLIKGQKLSKEYFEWYALGASMQVKITQLYESYLYCASTVQDKQIPQGALLYFVYNNSLSDSKKAYLYANIINNKDKNTSIYRTYLKQIEGFALRQITALNINRNLSVIYKEMLCKEVISEKIGMLLPKIMFKNYISCENPNIKGVYTLHSELLEEVYTPFVNGEAYIDIFTEHAKVFLVDNHDNRYYVTIEASVERLMEYEKYIDICYETSKDNEMLLLAMFDRMDNYQNSEHNVRELYNLIVESEKISEAYKCKIQLKLFKELYNNFEMDELDLRLKNVDLSRFGRHDKSTIIEWMILRGLWEGILEHVKEIGFSTFPVKRLLKLCSKKIQNFNIEEKDDILVQCCYYVFLYGKYDENILAYLVKHYEGIARNMYILWKSAAEFEIETIELEEKLLGQMLFADSYIGDAFSVFSSYYKKGSNKKLIKAFLTSNSYNYITHEHVLQEEFFEIIKKELYYEENEITTLALLKYFSTKQDLSEEESSFSHIQLNEFNKRGIVFPFFREFKVNGEDIIAFNDKQYVWYGADPSKQIQIHYRIINTTNESFDEEFITENFNNMYMGIRVKEFSLFYDEKLQYYITESWENDESVTESLTLELDENFECEESKYQAINLMLMTRNLNDEKTLVQMMKNYVKNESVIEELFSPL